MSQPSPIDEEPRTLDQLKYQDPPYVPSDRQHKIYENQYSWYNLFRTSGCEACRIGTILISNVAFKEEEKRKRKEHTQ